MPRLSVTFDMSESFSTEFTAGEDFAADFDGGEEFDVELQNLHLAITGNLTGQATAGNILEGKHAYVAQENSNREMVVVKIEGTMKDYPYAVYELDALEEDPTIYLPDGFYTEAEISISSTLKQALATI